MRFGGGIVGADQEEIGAQRAIGHQLQLQCRGGRHRGQRRRLRGIELTEVGHQPQAFLVAGHGVGDLARQRMAHVVVVPEQADLDHTVASREGK
jgi:hypothetical protein